jgi:hypothetical protein
MPNWSDLGSFLDIPDELLGSIPFLEGLIMAIGSASILLPGLNIL